MTMLDLKDSGLSWAKVAFLSEEIGRQIGGSLNGLLEKGEKEPVLTSEKSPVYSHIINHNLTKANHWYEIKLEHDIVTWQLKARGNFELNYCFEPSHATYVSLQKGAVLSEDTVPDRSIDAIYVMCETAGVVMEMEIWRFGEKMHLMPGEKNVED